MLSWNLKVICWSFSNHESVSITGFILGCCRWVCSCSEFWRIKGNVWKLIIWWTSLHLDVVEIHEILSFNLIVVLHMKSPVRSLFRLRMTDPPKHNHSILSVLVKIWSLQKGTFKNSFECWLKWFMTATPTKT